MTERDRTGFSWRRGIGRGIQIATLTIGVNAARFDDSPVIVIILLMAVGLGVGEGVRDES